MQVVCRHHTTPRPPTALAFSAAHLRQQHLLVLRAVRPAACGSHIKQQEPSHMALARRQQHQQQEESVYDWCAQPQPVAPHASSRAADSVQGSAAACAPRVRTFQVAAPAAAPARRMHEDSSQVESILKPVRGIRDAQRRAGITPTNHSRHNIHAVKEQSRLNALQKQQAAAEQGQRAARKPLGTSSGTGASSRRASSGGVDGSCSCAAAGPGSTAHGRSRSANDTSPAADDASCERDFVAENKAAAAAATIKRVAKAEVKQQPSPGSFLRKSEYGQVPAYLLERKMQLAQEHEALMAAKAAAAIPPGLRQMPEPERLETLALLQQNRAEVEGQLQALPIRTETHSQRRHKEALERRLAEIEEARKIFSRPNVLVRADGP